MFKSLIFSELTTVELYEILRSRAEIFVVEQNCVYQDLDAVDYESIHVFSEENGRVTSYLRIFQKKDEENTIQIGRVLTLEHGKGLGTKLLEEGLKSAKTKYPGYEIYIEAQVYAIGYYEKFGFKVTSEEFLEDGIPHVQMRL